MDCPLLAAKTTQRPMKDDQSSTPLVFFVLCFVFCQAAKLDFFDWPEGLRTHFLELSKGLVRFSRGVAFRQARLGARYLESRCKITEADKTVI